MEDCTFMWRWALDLAGTMTSKHKPYLFEVAKELHRFGFTKTLMGMLAIVAQFVVGASLLFSSDGTVQKLMAIVLVVFATFQFAFWAAEGSVRRLTNSRKGFDEAQPDLFDQIRSANPLYFGLADAWASSRKVSDSDFSTGLSSAYNGITSTRDPIVTHAYVFYAGLAAGILGSSAAVLGLAINLYPSTLAGSIIASLGFVTLACALISAEDVSERESLQNIGPE